MEGAGYYGKLSPSDCCDYGFYFLFGVDQRIGRPQLPQQMGIRGSHQGKAVFFCLLDGWGIEIDFAVVEMGKLDGIEELDIAIEIRL